MQIKVMLSSSLRTYVSDYDPVAGILVELDNEKNIKDLAEKINIPLNEITIIMLNGKHAKLEDKLQDSDRVGLFPAVGGG